MRHDWKELDSTIDIRNKETLLSIAQDHDCEYISELVGKLYLDQGLSISKTADKLGICGQTFKNWMSAWGIALRKPKNVPLSAEKQAEILSLEGSCSVEEAAKKCGCSKTSIMRLWQPIRKGKIKVKEEPKRVETRTDGCRLSTWKSRGVSKETWAMNNQALELERWRKHRGDTPIPLPNRVMRIGDIQGI